MLSTAKVIVRSPANAVDAVTEAIRRVRPNQFFMGRVSSWCCRCEAAAGNVVEDEGGDHKCGCHPERELNEAAGGARGGRRPQHRPRLGCQ